MKAQQYGDAPTTTRFSVFVGAFGMIVGALGLVAVFIDRIPSLVPMIADGLGALFFLAGGIAWAVAMKGQSCSATSVKQLYGNALLNQGCPPNQQTSSTEGPYCYVAGTQKEDGWPLSSLWPNPLKGICEKAFANETFQFVGFASFVILIGLGYLQARRKGSKPTFVA
ncbi:hypothetical protein N0V82_008037 [Gnomoniopsis sp. IMI 355080]|nr:hypothetical protein N0V82_008037 [Gnomoniopsis sp. IMI 355080]